MENLSPFSRLFYYINIILFSTRVQVIRCFFLFWLQFSLEDQKNQLEYKKLFAYILELFFKYKSHLIAQ